MTQKSRTLGELWSALQLGSPPANLSASLLIQGLAEPRHADAGLAVFVGSDALAKELKIHKDAVYFLSASLRDLPELQQKLPVHFVIKEPLLAFARATHLFKSEAAVSGGVHASAIVAKTAILGRDISIGPHVVIGEGADIGNGVILHAGVNIGSGAKVGAQTELFPHVVIYRNCELGERVRIHACSVIGADGFGYAQRFHATGVEHVKIEHLGRVLIGDDVEIGASSCIDRGTLGDTVIGKGTKIDNQVQIGHNCQINESVIICGSTALAGSAIVGKHSVVAGFVGIGNGTQIGEGATIAGFSMVFGNVPSKSTWGGVPARPLRETLRLYALMARLPELFKAHKLVEREEEHE